MSGSGDYYNSEPATWLRRVAEDWTGYEIHTDPDLAGRVARLQPDRGRLSVAPDLSEIRYHSVLGRMVMWVIGGDKWAPEWQGRRPRLHVVRDIPKKVELYPERDRYIPGGY